jgi:hypothetical protein
MRKTHCQSRTRLYSIWCQMIARCENKSHAAYHRYGGRGISTSRAWRESFVAFAGWASANGYEDHLTIDRINNDGHYSPENCRWATRAQQNRNYSRNRPVIYNGSQILVCDLALVVGLPQDILKNRIFRYGWDVSKAVSTPVLQRKKREPWVEAGLSRTTYYRHRRLAAIEFKRLGASA